MSKDYIVYYNWMTDGLQIENWLQKVLDEENLELISFQDKMWVFRKSRDMLGLMRNEQDNEHQS